MSRKLFAIITALSIIFTLSGCQLAREDGAATKSMDKLIEVYVSYDYVDLFNSEGYNNDNLNFSEGEIKIQGETKKYEGRMYATQKDEVSTSSEGEKHTNTQFVFEELPGIGMFAPTVVDPHLEDRTYISAGGDGFTDTKFHVKSGDNGEGGVYSQKLEDKVTMNENGKSKSYSSTIEVSIATMNPTIQVNILQMDKDSNVVKKAEYNPNNVPSELKTEFGTEYIIVESTKEAFNMELKIERTLFSKSDEALWFFKKSNDKVFVKAYTTILWE
ncbi:MAG: hypothetical protein GX992_04740 [Clostridium sp.]|nr:hypothetical protein [Clostridium sp.]